MFLHGGQEDNGVIDFSVNINPVVTDNKIESLLRKHKEKALSYPEIDAHNLEKVIEDRYEIKEGCVYVGNGATDCLYQLALTLKAKTVLVIEPTFTEYKRAFSQNGATVLPLVYDRSKTPAQAEKQLLEQMSKIKAEVIVLCNPNNPTGQCYSSEFIGALVQIQKVHKGYVLVDESFRFFEEVASSYQGEWWNLIVLTSLTKYYGVPGLRIGYLTSNVSLVGQMKALRVPWSVNGLALACTEDLLNDTQLSEATKKWYEEEKVYLWQALSDISYIEPIASRANYYLCRLKGVVGSVLNQWLREEENKMAIRTCEDFNGLGDTFIRIGFRSHEDNEELIEGLKRYEGMLADE